ncbi:hypothetical protein DS031_21475 [Bacillus taeanensis]|uniref:Uncharacterized protein n=1 Tax=Bacillus taeanensis TaxID=273032 RepID=A0A366XN42_9BACI|nr:hypothetical protein DS031_21475 [Bacillus taeanensis]
MQTKFRYDFFICYQSFMSLFKLYFQAISKDKNFHMSFLIREKIKKASNPVRSGFDAFPGA